MTCMALRSCIPGLVVIVLAAGACGGGTGESEEAPHLSDPALAPTATSPANPVLYRVRGGEIIVDGASTEVAAAPTVTPRSYVVVEGDTCSAIAGNLGLDIESLMAANRTINSDCTNLHVGDLLRVPGAAEPAPTPRPGSGRTYTVSAGDTCAGIAQSFSVDVDELIAVNGLDAECHTLQPDQILTIP